MKADMANPLEKLSALRSQLGDAVHVSSAADADALTTQRINYRLFVEDRMEEGWSDEDVKEFSDLCKEAMKTPEGAASVADFLADQAGVILAFRKAIADRQHLATVRLSQPVPESDIFLPKN